MSSARVSLGGRRTEIMPLGNSTLRKKTASMRLPALMPSAHLVSSARAANMPPRARMAAEVFRLGKNFNFHLPAADVVGEVFGGHGHFILSGGEGRGDQQVACVRTHFGVPLEIDRRGAGHAGNDGARGIGRADVQFHGVSAMDLFVVQPHFDDRGLAGDDECFRLAIGAALFIAQQQADLICAIGEILGSEESSLPSVFAGEVTELFHGARRGT